jgi:hypothetical protein
MAYDRQMPRNARRLLLSILFLVAAVAVYVFFGLYLLLGLILLNIVCWALAPLARKRGWSSEGRLTRYLSRPRIEDPSRASQLPTLGPPRARID